LDKDIINLIEISDLNHTVGPVTPITPAPAFPSPKVSTTPKSKLQDSLTIAYIDDSPVDSQLMGEVLIKAGYQYLGIRDPLQALQTLLDHKPKFIFLDLVMPIANGYEICTQLRRVSIFKQTPIVIVTGNDGLVDRVRAKLAGASGFIAKPINTTVVMAVLRKHGILTASTASTTVGIQTSRNPELLLDK
jgi:chemotaxis family two-component system response regulator PixG